MREKIFKWDGKEYKIPAMKFMETKEYFSLIQESQEVGDDVNEQLRISERILEVLHCPREILDELYADEVESALTALGEAHFPPSGDAEGNPQGGELTH